MASNLQFVEYVCDQIACAGEIRYRKMFGDYTLYCNDKVIGLICDDQLFIKPTKAGEKRIPYAKIVAPYPNAKPCILIPYTFEMELENEVFVFEIDYNERYDFFTITLYKNDIILVQGEKMILNRPLFEGISDVNLPKVTITPVSNSENRITFDNLGESVFFKVE